MTLFNAIDYARLSELVFRPDYPGFRPHVAEAPDGNATQVDGGKKYAHVATKYLLRPDAEGAPDMTEGEYTLYRYLRLANRRAVKLWQAMPGHDWDFAPQFNRSALRVLQYAPGVGGHLHTDISLFTLNLYRSVANPGLGGGELHIGRLGELLGLGPAEPHRVDPLPVQQDSIVFFALPDHAAVLPGGCTVGEWVAEQMKTMRYTAETK